MGNDQVVSGDVPGGVGDGAPAAGGEGEAEVTGCEPAALLLVGEQYAAGFEVADAVGHPSGVGGDAGSVLDVDGSAVFEALPVGVFDADKSGAEDLEAGVTVHHRGLLWWGGGGVCGCRRGSEQRQGEAGGSEAGQEPAVEMIGHHDVSPNKSHVQLLRYCW